MTPRANIIWWTVLIALLIALAVVVRAQPIMPVAAVSAGDTNAEPPQVRSGMLSWNIQTNALLYRWTNSNAATNQGGWTTTNKVAIVMTLGTNRASVRSEKGTNISAWTSITNRATATNAVGITGIQTRSMAYLGAAWGPWLTTTQTWYDVSQFQKQWRPILVHSNWWRLDKL
jgi:hypothetical protein